MPFGTVRSVAPAGPRRKWHEPRERSLRPPGSAQKSGAQWVQPIISAKAPPFFKGHGDSRQCLFFRFSLGQGFLFSFQLKSREGNSRLPSQLSHFPSLWTVYLLVLAKKRLRVDAVSAIRGVAQPKEDKGKSNSHSRIHHEPLKPRD